VSVERFGLLDRLRIRLYAWARDHLPEGYVDTVWQLWIRERVEALRGKYGDSFVIWLTTDLAPDDPNIYHRRERRLRKREVRNPRQTP